jgi:hypothetical protein
MSKWSSQFTAHQQNWASPCIRGLLLHLPSCTTHGMGYSRGYLQGGRSIFQKSSSVSSFYRFSPENRAIPITELQTLRDEPRHDVIYILQYLYTASGNKHASDSHLPYMIWLQKEVVKDLTSELFSNLSLKWIGDMLVLYYCMDQLTMYMPRSDFSDAEIMQHVKKTEEDLGPIVRIFTDCQALDVGNSIVEKARADGKRYRYPVTSQKFKMTVDTLREAETDLDEFWEATDRFLEEKGCISTRLRELLSAKTMQRKPPWEGTASSKRLASEGTRNYVPIALLPRVTEPHRSNSNTEHHTDIQGQREDQGHCEKPPPASCSVCPVWTI